MSDSNTFNGYLIARYLRVRLGFLSQGSSLHAWCRANGIPMPNAREALLGRWAWPSLPTLQRRWQALGMVDRVALRLGLEEAVKRLAQPALRDKTSINALEWMSLARLPGRIGGRRTSGWTSAMAAQCGA